MTRSERRKILCSVSFHVIAITCVVWSLWVLIERTAQEIEQGQLNWPFWTKLVVVAIGFTGGLVFMYVQCKVYVQLWKRLKAFNRIILVKDVPAPQKGPEYIWSWPLFTMNLDILAHWDNHAVSSIIQNFLVHYFSVQCLWERGPNSLSGDMMSLFCFLNAEIRLHSGAPRIEPLATYRRALT